jgi:cytochrome c-type biogenesis protein CcmE|tara:strand:+ start:256 stop:684 length:429 start_codon:yes stop_codon:yes gene_type:complete
MLTKKVKNRILFLSLFSTVSALLVFFVIKILDKNLLYFRTPTEINQSKDLKIGKSIRLGGMVKKDSLLVTDEEIRFIVTDLKNEIIVSYRGTVPNLFAEEKGVIAEGVLQDKKYFIAKRILAKHDENYMPPELGKVLKKNAK